MECYKVKGFGKKEKVEQIKGTRNSGRGVKYSGEESLNEKDRHLCKHLQEETVSNADGYLGYRRAIQAERTTWAKVLRQKHGRCVQGRARGSMWLEQVSRQRTVEDNVTKASWGRGQGVTRPF